MKALLVAQSAYADTGDRGRAETRQRASPRSRPRRRDREPEATIAKMRRDTYGASSERGAKLLDQLELQLAELS